MKRHRNKPWIALLIGLIGCATAAFLFAREQEDCLPEVIVPPLYVETMRVERTSYRIRVPAWGVVEPCETIEIRAEISGKIAEAPSTVFDGAEVFQGALLCQIDDRDCRNALKEAIAMNEQARQSLAIEKGRQAIAKTEWKLLEDSKFHGVSNKALALREPQLKDAVAAVRMAETRQTRAELDIERTRITSPCSGVVLKENVAKGQVLNAGDVVATIACTEHYHILAAYSPEYSVASENNSIPVSIGPDKYSGAVKSTLPQIHPETRQKQALVAFQGQRVVLGAYATLALPGPSFRNAAILPAEALRQDNSVWVFGDKSTLEIRAVEILARDSRNIVVGEGLAEGEEVILSHVSSPLQGMKLQRKANRAGISQFVPGSGEDAR